MGKKHVLEFEIFAARAYEKQADGDFVCLFFCLKHFINANSVKETRGLEIFWRVAFY